MNPHGTASAPCIVELAEIDGWLSTLRGASDDMRPGRSHTARSGLPDVQARVRRSDPTPGRPSASVIADLLECRELSVANQERHVARATATRVLDNGGRNRAGSRQGAARPQQLVAQAIVIVIPTHPLRRDAIIRWVSPSAAAKARGRESSRSPCRVLGHRRQRAPVSLAGPDDEDIPSPIQCVTRAIASSRTVTDDTAHRG